jgi:hypothetical protein
MNISKRTFNPLFGKIFRYEQSENSSLQYTGNWGPAIKGNTITASAWTVENGDAVLSSEAFTTAAAGTTSVIISGTPGENTIVNKVTLSSGEVEERMLSLKISDNDELGYMTDYGFD